MSQHDDELKVLDDLAAGKATPKRRKGGMVPTGTAAGSLSAKSAEAQKAAVIIADRDAGAFAQTYMTRFDANMQAINGKLGQVWGTVGGFDEVGEVGDLPPFTEALDQMFSEWHK